MIKFRVLTLAGMGVLIAGAALAASPAQIGTWAGTAKVVKFSAGSQTVTKQAIQLELAADNSTTVSLDGVQVGAGVIISNDTDLVVQLLTPDNGLFLATFIVSKTKMKGTSVGFIAPAPNLSTTFEVKYKLKKQ